MSIKKICQTGLMFFVLLVACSGCSSISKKNDSKLSQTKFQKNNRIELTSPLLKENEIVKELTGKSVVLIPTQAELRDKPLSTQHYYAGLRFYEASNYIKAIKHFNTVIKNYPKSAEVRLAYLTKAKIYNEMGLKEPAQLNLKLAKSSEVQIQKKMIK